jgi:hypothetical protein
VKSSASALQPLGLPLRTDPNQRAHWKSLGYFGLASVCFATLLSRWLLKEYTTPAQGSIVFSHVPDRWAIAGMLVIVASGFTLGVMRSERKVPISRES